MRPLSCSTATPTGPPLPAAGLATLATYATNTCSNVPHRSKALGGWRSLPAWAAARHRLPQYRSGGLNRTGSIAGKPTQRAFSAFLKCYERGR